MKLLEKKQAANIAAAQANGRFYGLLATGLIYPSAGGPLYRWADPQFRSVASADVAPLGARWQKASQALLEAGADALTQPLKLGVEHNRLFAVGRKIPAPPYELLYTDRHAPTARLSQELADITGYYRAFGLGIAPGQSERPDHIALELEYLSALYQKESYALINQMDEAAAICRDAQSSFLESHLGCWAQQFGEQLALAAELDVYRQLGRLLGERVAHEMKSRRLKPRKTASEPLPLSSTSLDEKMTCDASCAQSQRPGAESAEIF